MNLSRLWHIRYRRDNVENFNLSGSISEITAAKFFKNVSPRNFEHCAYITAPLGALF